MSKKVGSGEEHHHFEEGIKLIFRGIIPLTILIAGIYLLTLKIAGWSVILGLPMTVLGVILLIYTYDEIVSQTVGRFPKQFVRCSVCGKPTPELGGVDKVQTVCPACQEEGI